MCTKCATPARRAASATRRVPWTLTRCSISGLRPGCSAQARCTTASAPSRKRSSHGARPVGAALLGRRGVDPAGGWLVTQLRPGEVAGHPAGSAGAPELYLVCDDVEATVAELAGRGVAVEGGIRDERWGRVTSVPLPG